MKRIIFLLALVAAPGCTLSSSLERSAVDYNQAIHQVEKNLMLMNIVRSVRGESMTFSGIGEMRGSFSVSASASLAVPLGNGSAPEGTLTPSGSVSSSPSLQVVPLSTAEFYRGIASSVDEDLLHVFWEQGVSKELLLHLLIERIVISSNFGKPEKSCPFADETEWSSGKWESVHENMGANKEIKDGLDKIRCIYENIPPTENISESSGKESKISAFAAFQRMLEVGQFTVFQDQIPGSRIGPIVGKDQVGLLKIVSDAHDGDLVMKANKIKGSDKYFMSTKGRRFVSIYIKNPLKEEILKSINPEYVPSQKSIFPFTTRIQRSEVSENSASQFSVFANDEYKGEHNLENKEKEKISISIDLRSPEGVIYYLGELARVSQTGSDDKKMAIVYRNIYDSREKCLTGSVLRNPINIERIKHSKSDGSDGLIDPDCVIPLFVLIKGEGEAATEVNYRGNRYYIPSRTIDGGAGERAYLAGQSLRALAIARQIFNLNTSRKDLPATQSVIAVGN